MKKYNFPVATHSYFKVINLSDEKAKFLASSDYMPKFLYPKYLNEESVLSRQKMVTEGSNEYRSLECVLCSLRLRDNEDELRNFRTINESLFGLPNKTYAIGILSRILSLCPQKTGKYCEGIISLLGDVNIEPNIILGPSKDVFLRYKGYFDCYRKTSEYRGFDVSEALQRELVSSGLLGLGWTLQIIDGNSHARIYHKSKKIKIGKDYNPRTSKAAERIAVHEVYGHALRDQQSSVIESEGFALVLEQLLGDEFRFRRSYRFIAASLGWGIFGRPMNFREVFEVIWRLMAIASRYSEKKAKECAFDECCRVFRGGRPDLPGAVYLKDIVYFEANIKIWNVLSQQKNNYIDFVNIIEGRSTITT